MSSSSPAVMHRAEASPTAAQRGRQPEPERRVDGEIYSELINLAGSTRFTSQRVVLFAVLAAQGKADALVASREALVQLDRIHRLLTEGDGRLPGLFCDELRQAFAGSDGAQAALGGFIVLAQRTHDAIEARLHAAADRLDELVEAATPLLTSMNALTRLYQDLARRHAAQARRQFAGVMGDIQAIAKEARIVSFNAQMVAARAHSAGREFAVVAGELSHITQRIDDLVRQALHTTS